MFSNALASIKCWFQIIIVCSTKNLRNSKMYVVADVLEQVFAKNFRPSFYCAVNFLIFVNNQKFAKGADEKGPKLLCLCVSDVPHEPVMMFKCRLQLICYIIGFSLPFAQNSFCQANLLRII